MKRQSRLINRPFEIPGRHGFVKNIQLASGLGGARVAIGLSSQASSQLPPISLTKGGIPIAQPRTLPWTGDEPFHPSGLQVIIDSFQFECNIGRNVVYPTVFFKQLIAGLFGKLILGSFTTLMAQRYAQARRLGKDERQTFEEFFSALCYLSVEQRFKLPEAVENTAFIPDLNGPPHSLNTLKAGTDKVYYSNERIDSWDWLLEHRHASAPDNDALPVLSLANQPTRFRDYLDSVLRGRLVEMVDQVVVRDESHPDNQRRTDLLRQHLQFKPSTVFDRWNPVLERLIAYRMPLDLNVIVADFYQVNGLPETHRPTLYRDKQNRLYFNRLHPHIANLFDLLEAHSGHGAVAAHFLLREALYDPKLGLSITQREQHLVDDLLRFAADADADADADQALAAASPAEAEDMNDETLIL